MSGYRVETTTEDARHLNSAYLRQVENSEKTASLEGSLFIREKVRQEAAVDEVVVPRGITENEIDRDEDTEDPKVIIEKEPDSYATFVPFLGTPESKWFTGPRYAVYFGKIVSQRYIKSKLHLMTSRTDIRKVIADNSVKDMSDQKDKKWRNMVMGIINRNAAEQETKAQQFTSTAFKRAFQKMLRRRRPIGKMILTQSLFMEALDLPASSVGNAIAETHYREGIQSEEKLFGVPVVTTIKNDIYDQDEALIFSPQEFLGNAFTLIDATLHIKQEAEIVEWYTYMVIALGIGNHLSFQRLSFGDN